jgi:hypothetical protein
MATKPEVPIWEKSNLTVEEAAEYSGIGRNKLRELSDTEEILKPVKRHMAKIKRALKKPHN